MQIIVNNILTNYQISGSGSKTLLLLHGWGSSSQAFSSLTGKLSSKFKIISLDLPGMGKSEAPQQIWDLDNYKNFILAFLIKLNLQKLDVILGHSNGGTLAIKIASDQLTTKNLKLSKLILVGSAGIRNQQETKKNIFKLVAKVGSAATSVLPASLQNKLKRKLYQAAGSEALDNPALEQTFRKVVEEDIQNLAGKIKIPTLIIYGEDDTDTPPQFGEILASEIQNAKLNIISGAGHYVFLDQPEKTLNLIERFINVK